MRHLLPRFRLRYERLLQDYFNQLNNDRFEEDSIGVSIEDHRNRVKLQAVTKELANLTIKENLCPIPMCPLSKKFTKAPIGKGKFQSKTEALLHHIKGRFSHAALLIPLKTNWC